MKSYHMALSCFTWLGLVILTISGLAGIDYSGGIFSMSTWSLISILTIYFVSMIPAGNYLDKAFGLQ